MLFSLAVKANVWKKKKLSICYHLLYREVKWKIVLSTKNSLIQRCFVTSFVAITQVIQQRDICKKFNVLLTFIDFTSSREFPMICAKVNMYMSWAYFHYVAIMSPSRRAWSYLQLEKNTSFTRIYSYTERWRKIGDALAFRAGELKSWTYPDKQNIKTLYLYWISQEKNWFILR